MPRTEPIDVLSLGAGVQSTAVLLMSCLGELPKVGCAIFANTQWEPPGVYEHLKWLKGVAEEHGIPVHIVTRGNIREDTLLSKSTKGGRSSGMTAVMIPYYIKYPDGKGMLRRQCTRHYKIDPVQKRLRRFLGYRPRQRIKEKVRLWMGISTDEAQRMKPSRISWIENHYPLIDAGISRQGCLTWMKERGYPEPVKSSCIGCPYKSNRDWRDMKVERPEEFADAVAFDRAIRDSTGENPAFLHRTCQPLDEVDHRTLEDMGQLTLFDGFGNECEGMCGV